MRAIKCGNDQAKFDALNKLVFDHLLSEDENLNATKWCNEVIHPTTGEIAFTVKGRINALVVGEIVEKLSDDWFPIAEL